MTHWARNRRSKHPGSWGVDTGLDTGVDTGLDTGVDTGVDTGSSRIPGVSRTEHIRGHLLLGNIRACSLVA